MGAKDGIQSIDDIIRLMDGIFNNTLGKLHELGIDTKAAELMTNVDNPDDEFKVRLITVGTEMMSRIKGQLDYLCKPVSKEGFLQQKLDGLVTLNNEPVPEGTKLEYFADGKWYFGVLHQNRQTKKFCIVSWDGKLLVEKIEQLMTRVR